MKKVLLSLLAVAALVLSCQNYDDEFAALNTKIASLESQITSLAELRTAVTGVQSSISSLQSAVAAAQAAAEAAGDAAEAAGDASAAAAASNAQSIAALATSISAIAADLVDLQTAIDGATTEADLDSLKSELNTTLAALQALIESNSTAIASLVLTNAELRESLKDLGVDVDSVLASNATFEGELTITNAAELAYAKSLGNKVSTIKGDVYIKVDAFAHTSGGTGTGLTASDVNSVTSQITYVVGNVKIDTDESLDLSKLSTVSGDYIVIGHDVQDDALISVGDDVLFNFDGPYTAKIQTVDNIYLVMQAKAAATASAVALVGTTSVDFLALTKASGVQSVSLSNASTHTSGGSISFGGTTMDTKAITVAGTSDGLSTDSNTTASIKIGQAPVTSISGGNKLTTVELHYAADKFGTKTTGVAPLASLSVTGTSLSSVTVMAGKITGAASFTTVLNVLTDATATINLPNLEEVGDFSSDALEHTFPKLAKTGGFSLDNDLSVSMPLWTSATGNIVLGKATSFSAPVLARVAPAIATGSTEAATPASGITANQVSGAVSFPALVKAGAIVMNKVTSFSAPLANLTSIDLEEAEESGSDVTIPVSVEALSISPQPFTAFVSSSAYTSAAFVDPSGITSLKLYAQETILDIPSFTKARTIVYKTKALSGGGAPVGTLTVSSANSKLTSLEIGGVLGSVSINTNAPLYANRASTALASIKTTGTIEDITITNNYDLTSITLDHVDSTTASTASVIVITNNHKLTSVTTKVKSISNLIITGNGSLTTLDLSSISVIPSNFVWGTTAINIDILGNYTDKTANEYSARLNGTVATATNTLADFVGMTGEVNAATATVARNFKQAALASLKPFFQTLEAQINPVSGSGVTAKNAANITIDLDYKYVTGGAVTTKTWSITGQAAGSNSTTLAEVLDLTN
jgi:predicted  nucleic acid-binding Zn-ribbon protein